MNFLVLHPFKHTCPNKNITNKKPDTNAVTCATKVNKVTLKLSSSVYEVLCTLCKSTSLFILLLYVHLYCVHLISRVCVRSTILCTVF